MDKKNLIIKLFKSLRGEKENIEIFTFEGTCFPNTNHLQFMVAKWNDHNPTKTNFKKKKLEFHIFFILGVLSQHIFFILNWSKFNFEKQRFCKFNSKKSIFTFNIKRVSHYFTVNYFYSGLFEFFLNNGFFSCYCRNFNFLWSSKIFNWIIFNNMCVMSFYYRGNLLPQRIIKKALTD